MASGMEFAEFSAGGIEKAVYIGRPNGRAKHFKEYTKSIHLQIAGKPAEWTDYPDISVVENPQQRDRRAFYRTYNGCLAVYDDKHKNSGWRTGRAYHALYAGIPVCAPVGNSGLDWCFPVSSAADVSRFATLPAATREKIWLKQKDIVSKTGKVDPLIL
jgi:hypothetical protein